MHEACDWQFVLGLLGWSVHAVGVKRYACDGPALRQALEAKLGGKAWRQSLEATPRGKARRQS
eukprot:351621-Chlamydomonas_euryale.AAC.1